MNAVKRIRAKGFELLIPKGYREILNVDETEYAIRFIKDTFQSRFRKSLNLKRVSAPPFVLRSSGLNDYLNGVEKPVSFNAKAISGSVVEVVQSLAKWKRSALSQYKFGLYEGLYTDMNAIRPDEMLDNLHSIYVDQWDWERIINESDRNLTYLKSVVREIYHVIKRVEEDVSLEFGGKIRPILRDEIRFIHAEELYEMFPDLTPKEREFEIVKRYGSVFIIGIGAKLKDGIPHDGRAPDYDDWSTKTSENTCGLNGDILVYYPVLDMAFELSSMGIRVNKDSLTVQLKEKGIRKNTPYHKQILRGELPQTIGGGIGQSRLCMFYLKKAHIGEVQSSIWPKRMRDLTLKNNIFLL